MNTKWIAFSYTLSARKKSSARVTLWRRLRRLGTVSPTSGIYILPATNDCVEAFQWLAQEVKHAAGQAIVMYVDRFDGISEQEILGLFQEARREDYVEIDAEAKNLEKLLESSPTVEVMTQVKDELTKLKRRYSEVVNIDYFESYESTTTIARLEKISQMLFPDTNPNPIISIVKIEDYQGKRWVTRPQPHVDRLACIWLIHRFIDADASIRFGLDVHSDEVAFDMNDAEFGHNGNLCTFETMIQAFQIETKGIATLAEIVHEIDLRDERFVHPEAMGIEAILRGWLLENLDDVELQQRGVSLFDGLLQVLSARSS